MDRRDFLRLVTVAGALGPAALAAHLDDLQAALDAAWRAGEPLDLPAGRFLVTRTLQVGPSGLRGAGGGATVLVAGPGLSGPVLAAREGAFELRGLRVDGAVRTRVGLRGGRFAAVS